MLIRPSIMNKTVDAERVYSILQLYKSWLEPSNTSNMNFVMHSTKFIRQSNEYML